MLCRLLATLALAACWSAAFAGATQACPWCPLPSPTLGQEIEAADTAVIVRLARLAPRPKTDDAPFGKSRFEVVEVLKGKPHLRGATTIGAVCRDQARVGSEFLMVGVDPKNLSWTTPRLIPPAARKYLREVTALPSSGPERLKYYQDYLESPEALLADDAFNEFARAPYDVVKALKPDIERRRVLGWIQSPEIPVTRRRLYLTLLGVCGRAEDLPLIESLMRSGDRKRKQGLDAMISCYLTIRGAEGMPLIEELFLANRKAAYEDTYAAFMAIRFHGEQDTVVPRPRLIAGLHCALDRPELADLIIPDLVKWQDWSAMDSLVRLFKEADKDSRFVRVPVINYLRACPLPAAREHIAELEKIDPDAVRRATTFFPAPPTDEEDDAKQPVQQSTIDN